VAARVRPWPLGEHSEEGEMSTSTDLQEPFLDSVRSDLHIHTRASDGAGNCTPAGIAKVAEGLGLKEIGFTDHAYTCGSGALGATHEDGRYAAAYFEVCAEIREMDSPLDVHVSWEVDYFDGGEYSFDPDQHLGSLDYVLLGHHYFSHMRGKSPQALADYFVRIYMEMAQEPYAHIVAHPFYVPPPPQNHGAVLSRISDAQFLQVFDAIRDNGKAAEITAYQFSADYRDVEQAKRMYGLARQTGVKFTLDSDAHTLAEVGDGLRSIHVLRELGFRNSDFVDVAGLLDLKRQASQSLR